MTQIVIPNADPVATLTFEDVVTVDLSTFTGSGDYISLSMPEYPAAKMVAAKCFVDFTSNPEGNFGLGPTDSIPFSSSSPALPTTGTPDTEMRLPISLLVNCDKSAISGVRIRLFATEIVNWRCLSIRACSSTWVYAPIDLDTLWHRVVNPPTPNGSLSGRTNRITNPSAETNTNNWQMGHVSWAEGAFVRAEKTGIPIGTGKYAIHVTAKKDATTTNRVVSIAINTLEGSVTPGKKYSAAAELYVIDSVAHGLSMRFDWYNSSLEFISSSYSGFTNPETGGFILRINGMEAPAEASLVKVAVFGETTISEDIVDFWTDSWILEEASEVGSYFDGSFVGAEWTGTANASTSKLLSNFPTAEGSSWPIIFRSNKAQGVSDPAPIDIKLGMSFVAGSFTKATGTNESAFNQIAAYFRDLPEDDQTMVELNGDGTGRPEHGFNQAQLDAIGHQPDYGRAEFKPRYMSELDEDVQSQIDTVTQWALERTPDETEHSYIEVKFKWCSTQAKNTLTIKNAEGQGYTYTNIPIVASSGGNLEVGRYVMLIGLVDNSCRVRIYKTDQVGNILENELAFDSGNIFNDDIFRRRKGRVGWWAQFADGDAFLSGFRTRGVNYGELESKEFHSLTPVKGASVFAGSTADIDLVRYLSATDPVNTSALLDPSVSNSGKAYKIITTPLRPLQGVATNFLAIDDPTNLDISFDINFPASEIPGGGLQAYLLGPYFQIIPLNLSHFDTGNWTHVKVSAPTNLYQTGNYQFVLMQALPVVSTTWYVDNVSIKTKAVKWWARSEPPTPWQENEDGWQPVGFTLNTLNGGVVFKEHGNKLQIKAQALHQDAEIHDFKLIPQYATLGRVIWPEKTSSGSKPSGSFTGTQVEGRTYKFVATATDSDGYPTFLWSLGDGTYDAGQTVIHTYKRPGTYGIICYITDNFGNTITKSGTITVS